MFYFKLYLTVVCFLFFISICAMGRSKERVESESNGRTALEEHDDRTKERVELAAMGCSSRTALKERDGPYEGTG